MDRRGNNKALAHLKTMTGLDDINLVTFSAAISPDSGDDALFPIV